MNLFREYIRASLVTERGDADYKEQMVKDIRLSIQTVNDEIESRHPAHAFPNSEHVEGSIGHVLDLISLKKKYGRSRSEHETQAILDKWRGRMGAGSGKGMAAWTLALTGGGLITADMVFLGGTFTALGLSGAGLNVIHEVMAGNAVDDDLKEYIRWDPEILEWMNNKTEDKLEDEWIDLLFDHISKNPKDNLVTFISINDFARQKLGMSTKGEKIQIQTNELRQYIRSLLIESTEYDSHFKTLMSSGYEGIKHALELADSLGIPPRELPWDKKSLDEYVYKATPELPGGNYKRHVESTWDPAIEKSLNAIGWTPADWIHIGGNHHMFLQRALGLREATEYDDHFKPLMGSGYEGIKQAMELADSLGIPFQELPWDNNSIAKYLHYTVGSTRSHPSLIDRELAKIGITSKEWAEMGRIEVEDRERELGLRESAFSDDDPDDAEKVTMLFFRESSRMGIQMAEMTPGLEDLAEELDDFRALVVEFVGYAEKMPGGGGSIGELESLTTEINITARKLVNASNAGMTFRAMKFRVGGINDIEDALIRDRNWDGARWNSKDQVMLDNLKDWART